MFTANKKLPHRFEPLIAVLFAVSDTLVEVCLSLEKLVLLLYIFPGLDHSLQLHIEELLQFLLDLLIFLNETANGCPTVCAIMRFFLIEFSEHVVRPVVGQ
ncbi:hypothetical protein A3D11_00620 [Candidatus Peribacteria bacterium RIFCSPHIGHO2_02_FULL_49_16]|nr:MAG: hypothetical protein A2880_03580 [Candidatus Peribacteria bacterium RIFCSPHIGHO2_01_FULL_49_38]OGJ59489.1 MAG: hypothetical protein A3D11_00620 [Candidatus Peribacteria bacterium RIFCSPHIGHO2_02_FULL_49_16]